MQRSRALVLVGCLGALVLAFAVPAAQAAPWPGPDTFGYRGESSAGAFPHKWNSIVGVPGSTQVFLTDDSYTGPVPIGFTFRHYDGLFTDAYLASNGYITLSATSATTISGTLPSVAAPHGVIAGAWTDWNPGCNTGTLHYGTFGTAPNRYFVYQFTDIDRYSYCGGAPEGTFQIILHEGGWVEMQYLSLALPIGSVTIGIENFAGNDGLTYLNSAGATTLTGFALRYYTNAAPQLRDDEAVAVEDQGTITIDVLGNDKDPEGDPIDIVSVTQPLKGTAAITGKFPNEKVTYKPHPDQNTALQAMDSFTYRVTDGQGNFAEATVQVLVEPVNDPPTYKVLPLAFAREDEPAKVEGWAYDFWLGPTEDEVATQAMRFDIEADPPGVALFRADPDGTLHIEPHPDANGVVTLTVHGYDTGGTAFGGTDKGPVRTSRVRILSVNDPPMFLAGGPVTVAEDATTDGYTVAKWASGMMVGPPTAKDEAGQALAFEVSGYPDGLFRVPPTLDTAGTLRFAANRDACTPEPVPVKVQLRDDGGIANGGQDHAPPATLLLEVTCTQDAPVAVADRFEVPHDQPTLLPVTQNDRDADGDPLTVVASTGRATPAGPHVQYDPAGFTGLDKFQYTVDDGRGGRSTATVEVTVSCPHLRARPTVFPMAEDSQLEVAKPGFLAGSTVPPGASVTILEAPEGMLAFEPDGSFRYRPPQDFHGTVSFVFEVSDGSCRSGARATIEVADVNDPPVAKPDVFRVKGGDARLLDVLANDSGGTDGDTFALVAVQQGHQGKATIEGSKVRYVPNPGARGQDRFWYTIRDPGGLEAMTHVDVELDAVPRVVAAIPDSYTALPDTVLRVQAGEGVLANDVAGDATLRASVVETTQRGRLQLDADGGFTYQPDAGFRGEDRFLYSNGVDHAEVRLAVMTAGPPVADFTYEATSVVAGAPVTFVDRSRSPDGPLRSWRWDFGDGGGSTAKDPQHVFQAPGEHIVLLTVMDSHGREASTTKRVFVLDQVATGSPSQQGGGSSGVVDAGPDLRVTSGDVVTLQGHAEGVFGLRWSQMAGSPVLLSDAAVARPTFVAGDAGTLEFRLEGHDRTLSPLVDTMQVLVLPRDGAVTLGEDLEARLVWRQVSGPLVLLTPEPGAVSFTVPSQPGHAFVLEASVDGFADTVRVRIVPERGFSYERVGERYVFQAHVPGPQTWQFGDGGIVESKDPAQRFPPGTHTVRLTVETPSGPMVFEETVRTVGVQARPAPTGTASTPVVLMGGATAFAVAVAACVMLLWRRR